MRSDKDLALEVLRPPLFDDTKVVQGNAAYRARQRNAKVRDLEPYTPLAGAKVQ